MSRSSSKLSMKSEDPQYSNVKSVLLVDDCEALCMKDVQHLAETLKMVHDNPVNIVSIFGNTGDGKSHTLNHLFFGGNEVFATSSSQVMI